MTGTDNPPHILRGKAPSTPSVFDAWDRHILTVPAIATVITNVYSDVVCQCRYEMDICLFHIQVECMLKPVLCVNCD